KPEVVYMAKIQYSVWIFLLCLVPVEFRNMEVTFVGDMRCAITIRDKKAMVVIRRHQPILYLAVLNGQICRFTVSCRKGQREIHDRYPAMFLESNARRSDPAVYISHVKSAQGPRPTLDVSSYEIANRFRTVIHFLCGETCRQFPARIWVDRISSRRLGEDSSLAFAS